MKRRGLEAMGLAAEEKPQQEFKPIVIQQNLAEEKGKTESVKVEAQSQEVVEGKAKKMRRDDRKKERRQAAKE